MSSAPSTPTRPLTPPQPTQPPMRFSPSPGPTEPLTQPPIRFSPSPVPTQLTQPPIHFSPSPVPTPQYGTPAPTQAQAQASTNNIISGTPEKGGQGAAFLLGVAILMNPRCPDPVGMPRTVVVDAGFCVGGKSGDRALFGCFRFYNKHNLDFSNPEMCEKYVIFASIAKSDERAELFSSENTWKNYDVIGDIIWIASAPDADAVKQRPIIISSGQTSNRRNDMFDISASQYVQQLRSAGTISASVSLADNPRFKNAAKKPIPSTDGTNAMVVGFLDGVQRLANEVMTSFQLALESVVFYPRGVPPAPVYQHGTPTPANQRSGRRALRFDDLDKSSSRGSPNKRRRLARSDEDSGSDDTPLAVQASSLAGPSQFGRAEVSGLNDE